MNLLFTCIGKRGYMADYFRPHLRRGEKILGTSHTPWTPGFQACDLGFIVPPIASDEYVPAILDLCGAHEIGGLLSFYDPDVIALSPHREAFQSIGVVAMLPGSPLTNGAPSQS
jgi:carbamoyl-phosphate synthase large subunit